MAEFIKNEQRKIGIKVSKEYNKKDFFHTNLRPSFLTTSLLNILLTGS